MPFSSLNPIAYAGESSFGDREADLNRLRAKGMSDRHSGPLGPSRGNSVSLLGASLLINATNHQQYAGAASQTGDSADHHQQQQQQQQHIIGIGGQVPPSQSGQDQDDWGENIRPAADMLSTVSDPRNLIVNYVPTPVTDDELRRLFEPYGTVESARIILDKHTNHPKGYGFVKYTTEQAAREAIKRMNGYEIANKRLRVTQANGPATTAATHLSPAQLAVPDKTLSASNYTCRIPVSASGTAALLNTQLYAVQPPSTSSPTNHHHHQQQRVLVPSSAGPQIVAAGIPGYSVVTASSPDSASATLHLHDASLHSQADTPTHHSSSHNLAMQQQQPQQQQQQQVYFAANVIPGGYQIVPQPLTLVSAGNTVLAQPVLFHGSQPPVIHIEIQSHARAHEADAAHGRQLSPHQQQQQQPIQLRPVSLQHLGGSSPPMAARYSLGGNAYSVYSPGPAPDHGGQPSGGNYVLATNPGAFSSGAFGPQ